MVERLPRVVPSGGRAPLDRTKHPMRLVTEAVATDPATWTPSRATGVQSFFDDLADGWDDRSAADPLRLAPLEDALDRGGIGDFGRCLDLGAGTGVESALLAQRFREVVAVDLSRAMLARAPERPPRVQADGARLPFADRSFDVVVLVNALLFASEMVRVVAPGATILWISSVGGDTPIYLSADAVASALGPDWSGVESEAGNGTWVALRLGS
jgi:SAM-dependent methyltransferase